MNLKNQKVFKVGDNIYGAIQSGWATSMSGKVMAISDSHLECEDFLGNKFKILKTSAKLRRRECYGNSRFRKS